MHLTDTMLVFLPMVRQVCQKLTACMFDSFFFTLFHFFDALLQIYYSFAFFLCVGSGKSYTMMGANMGQEDHSKGLIPRICDALFEKIAEVSDYHHKTYVISHMTCMISRVCGRYVF